MSYRDPNVKEKAMNKKYKPTKKNQDYYSEESVNIYNDSKHLQKPKVYYTAKPPTKKEEVNVSSKAEDSVIHKVEEIFMASQNIEKENKEEIKELSVKSILERYVIASIPTIMKEMPHLLNIISNESLSPLLLDNSKIDINLYLMPSRQSQKRGERHEEEDQIKDLWDDQNDASSGFKLDDEKNKKLEDEKINFLNSDLGKMEKKVIKEEMPDFDPENIYSNYDLLLEQKYKESTKEEEIENVKEEVEWKDLDANVIKKESMQSEQTWGLTKNQDKESLLTSQLNNETKESKINQLFTNDINERPTLPENPLNSNGHPAEKVWYIVKNQQLIGPYTPEEMFYLLKEGQITPNTIVKHINHHACLLLSSIVPEPKKRMNNDIPFMPQSMHFTSNNNVDTGIINSSVNRLFESSPSAKVEKFYPPHLENIQAQKITTPIPVLSKNAKQFVPKHITQKKEEKKYEDEGLINLKKQMGLL